MPSPTQDFAQQFAAIRELLACPACHGELTLAAEQPLLLCAHCGRTYTVVDGIPVLIAPREQTSSAQ